MKSFFASALITFMSASAMRLEKNNTKGVYTGIRAEIDAIKQYTLKYKDDYDLNYDTDKVILVGAAAWNSVDEADDKAFVGWANEKLDGWRQKVFVADNIVRGICPRNKDGHKDGPAVLNKLEDDHFARRKEEISRDQEREENDSQAAS